MHPAFYLPAKRSKRSNGNTYCLFIFNNPKFNFALVISSTPPAPLLKQDKAFLYIQTRLQYLVAHYQGRAI